MIEGRVSLPASKSISNRALIIQKLCDQPFTIHNLSTANDTQVLQRLLQQSENPEADEFGNIVLNAEDAGTTFRFLTTFLAQKKGEWILTGSDRMQKRPIGPLVKALRKLGTDVSYAMETFFPPLRIKGSRIEGGKVEIPANISSQFVSALLLVAPTFRKGLTIELTQVVTSEPYILMTMKVMEYFGVHVDYRKSRIVIEPQRYEARDITIENDWSAASYFYALAAVAKESRVLIEGLQNGGWQGDSILPHTMKRFGVHSAFSEEGVLLYSGKKSEYGFSINFMDNPDLAQTIAVVAAMQDKRLGMSGIANLQFKETDRIKALDKELNKVGYFIDTKGRWFYLKKLVRKESFDSIQFATYEDHRMAMALSAFVMRYGEVYIENPEVVKKSFPGYWHELAKCGIEIAEV